MITAKKIEAKKLVIYLLILAFVALVTLVYVFGESFSAGLLPSQVGSFLMGEEVFRKPGLNNVAPLKSSVLESTKLQSLKKVEVELIRPAVGQKNPFNEKVKK